ncbi:MAG: shikimate kinase [Symploca sp. SIO1B1]|nr:shikimate kinase [Symploca sp. SIO1C2]NER49843.1 shikimate kinase [Symploca sp. SIO1A3]NER96430.1 shikimate kinase [Symploca sp. SIO1B1]
MNDLLEGVNVFLIGMMGSGKTTVGHLLASQLGYRFCDSDVVIEQVAGKTINEIFAESGEAAFRQIESQVLSELSSYTKLVIATGGGVVIKPINWSYLHHGLIVWLDAPVEVLIERLKEDTTRPLLKQADPAQTLHQILEQRRGLYAEADLHIRIDAKDTPEQIASQIVTQIPTVLKEKGAQE